MAACVRTNEISSSHSPSPPPEKLARNRTHPELVGISSDDLADLGAVAEEEESGHGLDSDLCGDLLRVRERESISKLLVQLPAPR